MTTFAARVLDCIEARKTSQAALARAAKVSPASISDWARAVTQPENLKAEPLLRAAAFLEVNAMWLLTGKGQRAPQAPTVLTVEQPLAKYSHWPFDALDQALVHDLERDDLLRLEGAWLHAAALLGFSLAKQAAA